jgi:hypothetical protein
MTADQEAAMPQATPPAGTNAARASLAAALTFHASFDQGPDADVALGDRRLYTIGPEAGALTPGLGDPPLAIAAGRGRFGAALAFTAERSHVVGYRAERNVAYAPEAFRGTLSLWLSLDPADIPGRYCDPLQVTDKNYDSDCLWIDFTKNDTPSDFRLGLFGNRGAWDVTNQAGQAEAFFWRLLKVVEPPFARDRWTHLAITWDGVNSPPGARARLYFDGVYQGATGLIHEPFTWEVGQAMIRLGTGHYVGLMDDLAVFNRPLTPAEIGVLHGLDRGVADLHGR